MKPIEPHPPTAALSVIFPFQNDPELPHLQERLVAQLRGRPNDPRIEFILVESAAADADTTLTRSLCEETGTRYIPHENTGEVFSIGELRDLGAVHARGRAITFLDVDCRASDDFWPRLLEFMQAYGVSQHKKTFFVVPALYLTQEGTEEFMAADPKTRFLEVYLRWLHGDTAAVQTMAPCSSVMIVDRLHYLSVGGHRPEFRGHGFEDFELYHRLVADEDFLPRTRNYYRDAKNWNTTTYEGFRAQFSLLGRAALMANLFVVHLWHPRPKRAKFYAATHMGKNRSIWVELFKEFDRTKEHPEPLIDASAAAQSVLVLGKPNTNATRCLRDLLPLLGNPVYQSEAHFVNEEGQLLEQSLLSFLDQHGIDRILFNSPYGNAARKAAYDWCRRTGFPYLVFERGALPDSWFLDPLGFNADSASYDRALWDRSLTEDERRDTRAYISRCLHGEEALEKQGIRRSGDGLAARLRVGGRKVLFVPLQRPSDTVIRHMAGAAGSFREFASMIDEAAAVLQRHGWVVLCKKHPLELEAPELRHAAYAPDDAHFLDLVELADAVALINSGVGLYAMMAGKPCYIFGQAFYAFDGLNVAMDRLDVNDFCRSVLSGCRLDHEAVLRFVRYLRSDFYSFGTSKCVQRTEADGSLRNAATAIDFYEIRLPGGRQISYLPGNRAPLATAAPLFERYRADLASQETSDARTVAPMSPRRGRQRASPAFQQASRDIMGRKFAKLLRDPHRFFADSQYPPLRIGKHLFVHPALRA